MKLRSFLAGIASGLVLTAVMGYLPVMADEVDTGSQDNGNSQSMQQPTPAEMGSGNSISDMGSSNGMDRSSPDTGTGDDDY
jgi:hypothetical protein